MLSRFAKVPSRTFEGAVEGIDEHNGKVSVLIEIFGGRRLLSWIIGRLSLFDVLLFVLMGWLGHG
jgi:hypothetical protein